MASYTVNDLGDSIGVVALAVLVFDRTSEVAPTAGFFLVAKFFPALFSDGLTAHLDRLRLRRTLPTLYVLEAVVFAALAFLADEAASSSRWCSCSGSSTGLWRSPAAA